MIRPAPKPEPTVKEPKPLRRKKWGVSDKPREPLPPINPEREKKRRARRNKQRNSPANRAAKKEARERANGYCECGKCGGLPFDTTWGPTHPDYPEFHHEEYEDGPKLPRGIYVRRGCHHVIEQTKHPTRAPRRQAAGL